MKKIAIAVIVAVIMAVLASGNEAYALTTSAVIHLRLRVVGALSLDLEDEWVQQNLSDQNAEAFSELEEKHICVDKLQGNDSTIWRFTKTE